MAEYLVLRFEGPMQSWGSEAIDPRRPTGAHPRRSALAGLIGNALGWRHSDVDSLNRLQDALRFATREDRAPDRLWDYQTADLSQLSGFGRWGPTSPGGAFKEGTHILKKEYLADASFTVAVGLAADYDEVSLGALAQALRRPARPLFLGRKSCPPATPIACGIVEAAGPAEALQLAPLAPGTDGGSKRVWFHEGPVDPAPGDRVEEGWQRRNYRTNRFDAMERMVERRVDFGAADAPTE